MIKKLDWDSDFFGFNIAHLTIAEKKDDVSYIDEFVKVHGIKCIQTCCDVAHTDIIHILEEAKFRFADLRVTYSLDFGSLPLEESEILIADNADVPFLKDIAKSIAVLSRFYNDSFKKERAEELYQLWLEKAVAGRGDNVCLKAVADNIPIGFLTVKFSELNKAKIGLMGIKVSYRNKGFSKKLMRSLLCFLRNKGISTVEVVTQGQNIPAQNFYMKNGFRLKSIKCWFYKFY